MRLRWRFFSSQESLYRKSSIAITWRWKYTRTHKHTNTQTLLTPTHTRTHAHTHTHTHTQTHSHMHKDSILHFKFPRFLDYSHIRFFPYTCNPGYPDFLGLTLKFHPNFILFLLFSLFVFFFLLPLSLIAKLKSSNLPKFSRQGPIVQRIWFFEMEFIILWDFKMLNLEQPFFDFINFLIDRIS